MVNRGSHRRDALVRLGGAAVLDGGNVFTGPQLFSDVVGLNVEPGYVMANELGELVSVPRPFAERDGIMVNPPEDGEFFIVIHNDSTVDIDNAVVRGVGEVAYARSTNGTAFDTISETTAFNSGDVLRITVSGMGAYLSLTIPQLGNEYAYEPIIFNPSEDGDYHITFDTARTLDLDGTVYRGEGSVLFYRSRDGETFSVVSGAAFFQAGDVLRLTVSDVGFYFAFSIPRIA